MHGGEHAKKKPLHHCAAKSDDAISILGLPCSDNDIRYQAKNEYWVTSALTEYKTWHAQVSRSLIHLNCEHYPMAYSYRAEHHTICAYIVSNQYQYRPILKASI